MTANDSWSAQVVPKEEEEDAGAEEEAPAAGDGVLGLGAELMPSQPQSTANWESPTTKSEPLSSRPTAADEETQ